MRPTDGATDSGEEDGTFTCRVCQLGSGEAVAGTGAMSKTSLALKLCTTCIRKDELRLSDGSIVRFCFGHRRLEEVTSFKGKHSRCEAALAKIRASRKSAKAAKEALEVGEGGSESTTVHHFVFFPRIFFQCSCSNDTLSLPPFSVFSFSFFLPPRRRGCF